MKNTGIYILLCIILFIVLICESIVVIMVAEEPEFYKNILFYILTVISITVSSIVIYVCRRRKNYVYISFDDKNKDEAYDLINLIQNQYRSSLVFTKENQIEGIKITDAIAENMSRCSHFIVIIDGELSQLQVQEFKCWKHREMRIYPIILSETKIPSQLKDYKTYALDEFKCNIAKLLQLK